MLHLFARAAAAGLVLAASALHGARAETWLESVAVVELKGGVLIHDVGRDHNESNSIDINGEIVIQGDDLFPVENRILRFVLNPRLAIGGSVNTEGSTHQGYAAFDWQYLFETGIFVGASLGAIGHTGNLHQATVPCVAGEICTLPGNRKYVDSGDPSLGSRVLIRQAAEIGYKFENGLLVSVVGAHMSNAGLAKDNDGMDFVGVRFGYWFTR